METRSNATTPLVLAGLVLIAVGMLLAIFHSPGLSLPAAPQAMAPARRPASDAAVTAAAGAEPLVVAYTAEALRDPMMSLLPAPAATTLADGQAAAVETQPSSAEAVTPLLVQGLVWGGGRPQALIGGRLYEVGDFIGGAKILAITRDGVTVTSGGLQRLWEPVKPLQVSASPALEGGQP